MAVNEAKVEQAKALDAIGKSQSYIARQIGVSRRTVVRYIERPDAEAASEIAAYRLEQKKKFIEDAWVNIFGLQEILTEKIKAGESAFKNPKDIAITMGILVDKVQALERPGAYESSSETSINIVLQPPEGYGQEVPT